MFPSGSGTSTIFPSVKLASDHSELVEGGRTIRGKDPVTFPYTVTFRLCDGSVVLKTAFTYKGTNWRYSGVCFCQSRSKQLSKLTKAAEMGVASRHRASSTHASLDRTKPEDFDSKFRFEVIEVDVDGAGALPFATADITAR